MSRIFDVSAGNFGVMPNWVDIDRYSPDAAGSITDKKTVDLIYVGWLHSYKGVEYLIRAMALLAEEDVEFRLRLCGGGELMGSLQELVHVLGLDASINLAGWVDADQIPSVLRRADIFVFPSLQEGMPNAVLQAMACGCPIIATRISSIPELVEDGVNGFLVEPRSPEELAEKIRELGNQPALRRAMSRRNRDKMCQQYSISARWRQMAGFLGCTD